MRGHLLKNLADHFLALGAPLRKIELPFPLPTVEIRQHWHSKFHHDARNKWLRSVIAGAFHDKAAAHWSAHCHEGPTQALPGTSN
jgi:hypothetical protein